MTGTGPRSAGNRALQYGLSAVALIFAVYAASASLSVAIDQLAMTQGGTRSAGKPVKPALERVNVQSPLVWPRFKASI
jgi:hypothetical protein